MPTKKELEEKLAAANEQIKRNKQEADAREAKKQEGSHSIDHGTILDNHEMPDTNKEPLEDIIAREANDLSFWNNSWTWQKANRSYGNKPEDSWFINPTPKLIADVMHNTPLIYGSCEVALLGTHKDELDRERQRHLEFLRAAADGEFVSECLDLLTSYQSRLFEAVQQYLGRSASYEAQENNERASEDDIEQSRMKKLEAAASCRGWTARLISLHEAYHEVMTDERAYNLTYDFSPTPDTQAYNLYRWSVTNALNRIGRRLTRSVKNGTMDADRYRIPRPWLEESQKQSRKKADEMISDFS